MDDLISKQAAISAICNACGKIDCDKMDKCEKLQLPPANNSENPNSSDTISRAKAIEALHTWFRNGFDEDRWWNSTHVLAVIEGLPPAQPEPRWHPVSEQPQEDDDYLLLTHEKTKYGAFTRIIIGAWNGATKEWLEEYEGMYRDVNHPVAWMSKEELLLLKGWEVTE